MSTSQIALPYRLFLQTLEPLATFFGFLCATFRPDDYLYGTYPPTTGRFLGANPREAIVLAQLGNMYLTLALLEAVVLRSTREIRVWRAVLAVMLVGDVGHALAARAAAGGAWAIYWSVWEWNLMYWGNLGFVYVAVLMRVLFLFGIGVKSVDGIKGD